MNLKPEKSLQALEILKRLALFAGCRSEHLDAFVAKLAEREIPKGKVVMMDQEINKTLFILAKGCVEVWKRIQNEKRRLAVLEAPNFFGERSVFEESPASALVKTGTDCSVFTLERNHFEEVAGQYGDLTALILKNMETVRAQRGAPPAQPPPG